MTLSFRLKQTLLATTLISGCFAALPFVASASAKDVQSVASIKPIHSLLAGVTKGVSTPKLLITGNASPHNFTLKPSQVEALENADLILMVDEALERSLEHTIESLGKEKSTIEVGELKGILELEVRGGENFEKHVHAHGNDHDDAHDGDHDKHDHDDHDHDKHEHDDKDDHDHKHDHEAHEGHDHDDDKHEHEHEHEHDKHEHEHEHDKHDHDGDKHEHDHDKEHAHGDHEADSHFWLDPMNAKIIVTALESRLSEIDPDNQAIYAKNAADVLAKLDDLDQSIKAELVDVKGQNFIVFHDAYQYFENRYGLEASGSVTLSPELPANATRIKELQKKIADKNIKCIFTEPQFNDKSINVIIEGSDVKVSELDPIGASIDAGEDQYFSLLKNLATSFKSCLKQ